jgi:hypothetical protein
MCLSHPVVVPRNVPEGKFRHDVARKAVQECKLSPFLCRTKNSEDGLGIRSPPCSTSRMDIICS